MFCSFLYFSFELLDVVCVFSFFLNYWILFCVCAIFWFGLCIAFSLLTFEEWDLFPLFSFAIFIIPYFSFYCNTFLLFIQTFWLLVWNCNFSSFLFVLFCCFYFEVIGICYVCCCSCIYFVCFWLSTAGITASSLAYSVPSLFSNTMFTFSPL